MVQRTSGQTTTTKNESDKLMAEYDLEWLKKNALFGCQEPSCAEEVSYHYDMLAMYDGKPICQSCYEFYPPPESDLIWRDLPPFYPFASDQPPKANPND